MKTYIVIILISYIFTSCSSLPKSSDTSKAAFSYLKKCMSGSFSSAEQSKNDSDYFDIRLRMVPIWKEKSNKDQFYLYVEQAVASSLQKPYRQRIYKVERTGGEEFISSIYTVNGQERFINKNGDDPIFKIISPDSLQMKSGCEVYLTFDPQTKSFGGSTKDGLCPSDRNGASYTTSRVNIYEDKMISWDQGWNKENKQVWGATKGGYIFKKD